ncbi:MAG: glycine cleavage system protein GcvH [Candidatus Thorarchaeota archaeon]|nr:glycine cleavage system protein GcvH [Candidatus Thorarchaeota archaeon]
MGKTYILPCAGYDRPGGKVTRDVAELLLKSKHPHVVGSVAALVNERPGEVKDFSSSSVICLDGCSMRCASKIAEARGARAIQSIEVSEVAAPDEDDNRRAQRVLEMLETLLEGLMSESKHSVSLGAVADREEFLTEKVDKFTLRVKSGLYYSDNDFWVAVENGRVRVGASDLLQQSVSDIYYVELAELGHRFTLGDDIGRLESTKTMIEIIAPISGEIIERNDQLESSPELINESPYDKGWLYILRPEDMSELELLKDAHEYIQHASQKAKHELGKRETGQSR